MKSRLIITPKQEDRIRTKIKRIRKALFDERRKFGGYMDSRGLRYAPPELFLKINDYRGAMVYFRWFHKNFPDDIGFPIFLFEWAITLFKYGKIKEAKKKILQTFCSNTYLIDHFLGEELVDWGIYKSSNWEETNITENLIYRNDQEELADFAKWLRDFSRSEVYTQISQEFIEIKRQLLTEPQGKKRSELVKRSFGLLDSL